MENKEITEEILEKNGFRRAKYPGEGELYVEGDIRSVSCVKRNDEWITVVNNGNSYYPDGRRFVGPIKYVKELNMAMELCHLTKRLK